MTSFTVGTADLQAALKAVAPHTSTDVEDPIIYRVRLDVGRDVTVTATNRFTAACALVSIEENEHGELDTIDLAPQDVKEIGQLFKPSKDSQDQCLRIAADDDHVTITDCSGLFDGKQYRLPRRDRPDAFPHIPRLMSAILARPVEAPDRLEVSGHLLTLFGQAAKQYKGERLTVEPTSDRTSLIISCGESFLGLLMPIRPSDERDIELDEWRRGWLKRLPEVSSENADEVATAVRASLREIFDDDGEVDVDVRDVSE